MVDLFANYNQKIKLGLPGLSSEQLLRNCNSVRTGVVRFFAFFKDPNRKGWLLQRNPANPLICAGQATPQPHLRNKENWCFKKLSI